MSTITGLFFTYTEARNAVTNLKTAGVSDSNISLISNDVDQVYDMETANVIGKDMGGGAGIGAAVGGAGGLLAGLGLVAIPGVGPVVAAGWLAATLAGLVTGAAVGATAGGVVGIFSGEDIDSDEADIYAQHIQNGGTVVFVRGNEIGEDKVYAILNRHRNAEVRLGQTTYRERTVRSNTTL
jgi:hypothetical protein